MTRFLGRALRSASVSWPWLLFFAVTAVLVLLRPRIPALVVFPDGWTLPLAEWVNTIMDMVVALFRGVTRAVSGALNRLLSLVQYLLVDAPWLASVAAITFIGWQAGGRRLALLSLGLLGYILLSGYWRPAMNTLALVVLAMPISVLIGFGCGYLGFRSPRARKFILPLLDLMQTVPAFAYLIPILLLFGFGPVVGLIASVVFAVPPMVRNTMLGFDRIPAAILESARMSGCSPRQRFFWAEIPAALPQMLIGVNQTTMATLSMVIIAAIIGGFEDVGWEVLSSMRKAQFGQSLLSGTVIVILAILLDRITAQFARRQLPTASFTGLPWPAFLGLLLLVYGAAFLAARVLPPLAIWPESLVWNPAARINDALSAFVVTHGDWLMTVKNWVLFYLLLPIKVGFEKAIVPFTWGTPFTPGMKAAYWILAVSGCIAAFGLGLRRTGLTVVCVAGFLYFGATGLPWLTVAAFATLLAWQVGGGRTALFVLAGNAFLLLNGIWTPAMLSVYLCLVAVVICILLGGLIGIWAASSDRLSALIRPVNDLLQTLPQFVLLIPALMLFQVGDFSALLAIVSYAIVPMIRYTEHGLRSVPPTLVEAGIASGCAPAQLFWQVRIPNAKAQILIGINQTILYGLGMLVIAALVGTTGLGQAVYVALGKADAGAGLMAGFGIALIAMMSDRILQAVIGTSSPGARQNPP